MPAWRTVWDRLSSVKSRRQILIYYSPSWFHPPVESTWSILKPLQFLIKWSDYPLNITRYWLLSHRNDHARINDVSCSGRKNARNISLINSVICRRLNRRGVRYNRQRTRSEACWQTVTNDPVLNLSLNFLFGR